MCHGVYHLPPNEAQNLLGCTAVFLTETSVDIQLRTALMMEAARTSEPPLDIQ
jgi:hypothetical protein